MLASRIALALFALAFGAVHGAAAQPAQAGAGAAGGVMVVEMDLANEKNVDAKDIAKVFADLGADEAKVAPLLKRLGTAGDKALVTAGSKESCEMVAKKLQEIGMKVEIRPLSASDVPSEYDNSDVIPAGGEQMKEMIDSGEGFLVAFHAPWCKHCVTMAPELKAAATKLKESGVKVLAVDTQASPTLAQQLGVRMLPSIKWMHKVGENLAIAEYQGARDAASMVKFAEAAQKAVKEQVPDPGAAATKEADEKAAAGSKIGQSKLGKSKAAGPDSAAPSKMGATKVADSPAAATSGAAVEKAEAPAAAAAAAA